MMKNTDFQFTKTHENSSNPLKEVPLLDNHSLKASLASLESSGSKRADFRSSIDLETEPGSHNSSSAWKINSESDQNIKVTPAYFGGDPIYNGYFEEFTTHDPIDFEIELKESEDNYENNSSSSSSLSKSSKKISKLQKEEVTQYNAPLKYERAKGKKNPWQASEDAKVIELVTHYGQSWALIAAALGNRTGKQVRDRYLNYLRADIKDEDFTIQEDRLLLSLYYQWGHKWSKIASQLPGRTECQVKNRFYAHIKKRLAFPDILDSKNNQRNVEDMFFENNHAKENRFLFEDHKEGVFSVNDPTDVISYENKSRTISQISQSIHANQHTYSFQSTHVNENLQSTKKIEGEDVSIDFLSSFNNVNAFCDDALLKAEVKSDMKVESDPELIHHQSMTALQNDFKIRERAQRYEDLMRRKKALEYFYSKTLTEMTELGINDFSPSNVPK